MDDKTRTQVMKTAIKLLEDGFKTKQILGAVEKLFTGFATKVISEDGIEMYRSLRNAVDEAGGAGWDIDELCKMSVMDLISHLATNHIRFIHKPQPTPEISKE